MSTENPLNFNLPQEEIIHKRAASVEKLNQLRLDLARATSEWEAFKTAKDPKAATYENLLNLIQQDILDEENNRNKFEASLIKSAEVDVNPWGSVDTQLDAGRMGAVDDPNLYKDPR